MISKKMKYALKALTYLYKHSNKDHCIRTQEISENEKIPKKFLEQILLDLKKSGLVNSKQGNVGGYYIMKHTEKATIKEIYRLFDGPIALVPCASLNYYETCDDCVDEATCSIKKQLIIIRDQTLAVMEQVTLSTIFNGDAETVSTQA